MSTLTEGANTALSGSRLLARVNGAVDLITVILSADGKVASDADMVFFNQPDAPGVHLDGASVHLDLDALRPDAERVVLAVSPEQTGETFETMHLSLAITHGAGVGNHQMIGRATGQGDGQQGGWEGGPQGEDIQFTPAHLSSQTVAVLAEVYQRAGSWKVRAIGQRYDSGLAGLATDFGIQVDDDGANASACTDEQTGSPRDNLEESAGFGTVEPIEPMVSPGPASDRHRSDGWSQGDQARHSGSAGRDRDADRGPATGPVLFDLWNQRGAYLQVAGCQHHKEAIEAVLGGNHRPEGAAHDLTARLVPDPANPYDRYAVAVHVHGRRIGYLPTTEAAQYEPILADLTARGLLPQVAARIWVRTMSEWDDTLQQVVLTGEIYGDATLALGPPHLIVPANLPPTAAEMLPEGGAIQVSGVDQHVDVTSIYSHRYPQQWVHVSLHELLEQRARSTRTIVEVRLDGGRVGQLTPKMSDELLPAVRQLQGAGITTGARALLHGNQAAAKLTLYVIRSNALSNDWFDCFAR